MKNLRDYLSAEARRKALEQELSVDLGNIGSFTFSEKTAGNKNCENMIGAAQIPLGVAGPLTVNTVTGKTAAYYLPLATTEGALVASVNRGCKAITGCGGATVDSHRIGASRGPVFKVGSLRENQALYDFIESHFEAFKDVTEHTSHHLKLKKISSRGVGLYRFVRFVYDTQDAMGLNMVTIATDAAARYIEEQTGADCVALSGNFCVDKKPSWQNALNNRGTKVWAEVILSADILESVLKTSAQKAYETWLAKCMLGSAVSGSMGFNGQFANIVAALFLATGQDPAHVVEGSLGITTAEVVHGDDLYVSVYLPSLMVGTVGGGTALATQHEALEMLGVAGGSPAGENGKNARQFAEIVGAAALAGEISLLSSLEQGSLAAAHVRLGRGK